MSDRIGPGYDDARHMKQAKQDVADSQGHLMLCKRCDGTGNELYSMFRLCSQCDGVGAYEMVDSDE